MWKKWLKDCADLQIPVYAANACYFLALSIFPALLLILASLRYTPLSALDLIRFLEGILHGSCKSNDPEAYEDGRAQLILICDITKADFYVRFSFLYFM